MYKLLLILKYLRRKLAPMFAAVAVMLCTMMVIIVISVMGGFLHLLRDAAKKLTGDVVVTANTLTGFPHYDEMIAELDALPEVEVATPSIQTFGLINIKGYTRGVNVQGIRPAELDRIVQYRGTLLWTTDNLLAELDRDYGPPETQSPEDRAEYERRKAEYQQTDLTALAMSLNPPPAPGTPASQQTGPSGMVIGVEVSPEQRRDRQGQYDFRDAAIGARATLTLLPLTSRGATRLEPSYATFTIVNEFKSGLYDIDANTVFVPFQTLQRLLDMHPREVNEVVGYSDAGEPITRPGTRTGRTSQVLVKAAPGYDVERVRAAVAGVVEAWSLRHNEVLPPAVLTWEEVHRTLISAVQNETGLVTFLFVMISGVAVVMVATTFYMIVLEKTRDIGVLRAIGASRAGIRHIFLGYGFAVGVVGSLLGLAAAVLVVTHLNELQDTLANKLGTLLVWAGVTLAAGIAGAIIGSALGRRRDAAFESGLFGLVLGLIAAAALGYFRFNLLDLGALAIFNDTYGWRMWDPQTYFFDRIPDDVNPLHAGLIVAGAIVSSVIGALIPAFLASRQNPIEALRYE